jgi:hypothetical protein
MVPALDTYTETAAALTVRYPRGKSVRVYYNPRHPENSVLYPTPNLRVWIILAAGLYFGYAVVYGTVAPDRAVVRPNRESQRSRGTEDALVAADPATISPSMTQFAHLRTLFLIPD